MPLLADTLPTAQLSHRQKLSERRAKVQQSFLNEDPNAIDTHTHGFLWGMAVKTNGWKMTFRWLRTINPDYSYHVYADISEISHPREQLAYANATNGRVISQFSYLNGKTDILYPIHLGVGLNKYIVNKASNNGVFVQAFGTGGLIFGIQKPYNLEIIDPENSRRTKVIYYTSETSRYYNISDIEDHSKLRGRTFNAFLGGWDNTSLKSGIFAELGVRLGFAKNKGLMNTINVGVGLDCFFDSVPLMVNDPRDNLFFHFFASFEIGKIKIKK